MTRRPLILIALLLAAFVINVDTTIVNVALPTLSRELDASTSQLQWIVDAFNLAFAASVLVFGSLSDRFGRKGMLLAGLAVVGGWLLELSSWRSIFYAMAPVAVVAVVLSARVVPTSRDADAPRLDWTGFVLSTAMVALPVYTIIEAPDRGWTSSWTIGGFLVTALLAAVFVHWERRVVHPMLDLSLFANPRFTAASVSVAISFFALSGFVFLVTQYFQLFKGYGPLSTGLRLLPVASCVAIASILGARLAVRLGTKLVVASGLFAMTGFYLWVATTEASTGYGTIAAQMVVLGTGMGLTSAPATEAIMGVVPKAKAGVGSAVNDATRLLGGTLGVAVIGSIYASFYASRLTSTLPTLLPADVARSTHASVGAALTAAGQMADSGHPALALATSHAARSAFFHGFHAGNYVSAS